MSSAQTQPTVLEKIAIRICAFDLNDIPPEAYRLARTAIIDTLGVAIAGSAEPCTQLLLKTPGVATAQATALCLA